MKEKNLTLIADTNICPDCGRELPAGEGMRFCPYCGRELGRRRVRGWLRAVIWALASLLIAGVILLAFGIVSAKYLEAASVPKVTGPESMRIELPSGEGFIYPGDELAPSVYAAPADASLEGLSWRSSDTGVAVVDSYGAVRAVGEGEAEIIASAPNGVEGSLTISVKKRPVSLSFDESEILLKVGESFLLEPKVEPEGAEFAGYTVAPSEEGVVTIGADGIVTGTAEGGVSITVTAVDGVSAVLDVFVYSYESDLLADFIIKNGERDEEAECFFYPLDRTETKEDGLNIVRYAELIYYPDDRSITLCGDIYDEKINVYYETNITFARGDLERADVWFRCAVDGGGEGSHTVHTSAPRVQAEAGGSIALSDYAPGDPIRFTSYRGEAGLRESSEMINSTVAGYAVNVLAEKWESFSLPFTIAETLGLEKL